MQGLSDRDILDSVQVLAHFNYTNRAADAFDPEPEMASAYKRWNKPENA